MVEAAEVRQAVCVLVWGCSQHRDAMSSPQDAVRSCWELLHLLGLFQLDLGC